MIFNATWLQTFRTFSKTCFLAFVLIATSFSCTKKKTEDSVTPSPFSFSPVTGTVGSIITLSGMDFSSTTAVRIGATPALILSQNSTELKAFIMPSSLSGAVSLVEAADPIVATTEDFSVVSASAPIASQQGGRLIPTDIVGSTISFGSGLALTADGNTMFVGGSGDSSNSGAVWIFTRSGSTWTQVQKLTVADNVGAARFGASIAVTPDGQTAVVGGSTDSSNLGATWVFAKSESGTWAQTSKLVGTGYATNSSVFQGHSVAVSATGETILIGGYNDNVNSGAAWIFENEAGVWTQKGSKIVPSGALYFGMSVALDALGTTALVGSAAYGSSVGGAFVYVRSQSGTWAQEGTALVGTGNSGNSGQGIAVALSADGNTAMIGGSADDSSKGAVWVFAREGTSWSQVGTKLVTSDATGIAQFGISLALSADGGTAVIGGQNQDSQKGAFWVFTRANNVWSQSGTKLMGTEAVGNARQGSRVSISSDGSTSVSTGTYDNSQVGAAWVFVP